MAKKLQGFSELAKEAGFLALEKQSPVNKNNYKLNIGIPKEITFQECRVPLTPAAVSYFVNNGHHVVIESNAGKGSNFPDKLYADVGAKIVSSHEEVFKSDIILKIDPPTEKEIDMMRPNQLLLSALQLNQLDELMLRKLMNKKVNAIAYEFMEDDSGTFPIVRAMSEIAGAACIMIAAEYLNNSHIGKGELLGGFAGIPPTQVVIIGAGAVGEYAAKTAMALGANIKIFDNNIYRLRRIQKNLGQNIYTSTIHPMVLANSLTRADVVIGALRGKNGRSPMVVSEAMVANMKPRSVIIDVSIDQGGVFETSEVTNHEKPIFRKFDVIHYCVPNITSRVSRTASYALSNIFTPMLDEIVDHGGFTDLLLGRHSARKGVYLYQGNLTNKSLADKFNLKFRELSFMLSGVE